MKSSRKEHRPKKHSCDGRPSHKQRSACAVVVGVVVHSRVPPRLSRHVRRIIHLWTVSNTGRHGCAVHCHWGHNQDSKMSSVCPAVNFVNLYGIRPYSRLQLRLEEFRAHVRGTYGGDRGKKYNADKCSASLTQCVIQNVRLMHVESETTSAYESKRQNIVLYFQGIVGNGL